MEARRSGSAEYVHFKMCGVKNGSEIIMNDDAKIMTVKHVASFLILKIIVTTYFCHNSLREL